jgi:hypothetical protein
MNYCIISSTEASSLDFSDVVEGSVDTLRYSLDGTKTFVKFYGETPISLLGKTTYNNDEMREILITPEWSPSLDL